MILSFASSTTASLVAKNRTKKSFQTSQFFIAIMGYIEAEIDYRPFLLFYRVVSQDYAQFDQN